MKAIYAEYKKEIEQHFQENLEGAQKTRAYLGENGIMYHDNIIRTLGIPVIFTEEEIEYFRGIVRTTYQIFEKVIRTYLKDPSYRKIFPFSEELESLILTPRGYTSVLPIARFDIFYNDEEKTFKFCEINTDGTSAMNEDRHMNIALPRFNPAHQEMMKRYRFTSFEMMDRWVQTFLGIYREYADAKREKMCPGEAGTESGAETADSHGCANAETAGSYDPGHPHVAIVDFLEGVEIAEFHEFARRFEQAGVTCEVCEITELSYEDHRLLSPSGKPIDAVYRRIVTTDVMANQEKIQPFIQAVKHQDVCIVGAFCTQVVHNKWLFKILHEEPTASLLTREERDFVAAHVPYTALLNNETCDLDALIRDKDRWLIKPLDSYASKGVYAGRDCTPEEWAAHIREHAGHDYIYQEFCPPYRTTNIDFIEKEPAFAEFANMTGLYVYNGELAGIYSRMSGGNIISSQYNERDNATLVVHGK